MHWLDLTILLVLGVGAFWGALNGFVRQIARVAVLILGIYLCVYFHEPVARVLSKNVSSLSPLASGILTYAVIFFGTVLVGYLITLKIESMVTKAKLQPVNRTLGAGVGVLKMGLLCGVVLMGVLSFSGDRPPRALTESRVTPYVLKGMRGVLVAVPQRYKENLSKPLDRWETSQKQNGQDNKQIRHRDGTARQIQPSIDPTTFIPTRIEDVAKSSPSDIGKR